MADLIASTGEKRGKRGAGKVAGRGGEPMEEQAKASMRDALEPLKAPASRAAQRSAKGVGEQMREAAESLLLEQKDRVADAVRGLGEALREAAHTFEREERQVAAHYADEAAAQIDRYAEALRRQTLGDMRTNAEDIARRQPALFVAGAVAVGFVVGRLLSRPRDGRRLRTQGYATSAGESSDHHARTAPQSGAGAERA